MFRVSLYCFIEQNGEIPAGKSNTENRPKKSLHYQLLISSGGEGGLKIEAPIGEQEARGWRALVCLLFSTRLFDFKGVASVYEYSKALKSA